MRIGNQTAFAAADWIDPFRFAMRHGFGAFEWFADRQGERGWDFSLCDVGCRRELRREGAEAGIHFTVHAPWQCDPSAPAGKESLRSSLVFARDVGASLVVLHLPAAEHESRWISALAEPIDWANDARIELAFENTVLTSPNDCNRIFAEVRQRYGAEAPVGMCLDVGHANLSSATHNDYLGFLDALDPGLRIVHLHLHENWGETDQHLVLFTGPAGRDDSGVRGLLARLLRRGYQRAMILEQWPDPPELLVMAAQRLARLLEALGPDVGLVARDQIDPKQTHRPSRT
jgi:sugar phosphate isomerase/epimerase